MSVKVMPWGKHKGTPIDALPSSYLHWLAENVNDEYKGKYSVCLTADAEYQEREAHGCHFENDTNDKTDMIKCPHCGKIFKQNN